MPHDHSHSPSHAHSHAPPSATRPFAIGVALNLSMVVVEVVFGLASRSMALIADAGHNASDVLGLALAWGAARLVLRSPTAKRTYGHRRVTIAAAVTNSVILLLVTGALGWESILRLASPAPIDGKTVMIVAAATAVVNAISAALFVGGHTRDLNARAAFLHLAGDAAIALGVVASGAVVAVTGATRVDPIVSLVIAVLILASTIGVLRRALDLLLDAVPEGIDADAVRAFLASRPEVVAVHDLHIWAMSTTETALTAHLVVDQSDARALAPAFLGGIRAELHARYAIGHVTLQLEPTIAGGMCPPTCETPSRAPEREAVCE